MDYGVSIDGFRNPLTSIITNAIFSVLTNDSHMLLTAYCDFTTHYEFQDEVIMNCCIT